MLQIVQIRAISKMVRKQKKMMKWQKKQQTCKGRGKDRPSYEQQRESEEKSYQNNNEIIQNINNAHKEFKNQEIMVNKQIAPPARNFIQASALVSQDREQQKQKPISVENLSQEISLFKQIELKLNEESSIYERETQIQKIRQFIQSKTEHILYVCGVVGTGKTSTIIQTFKKLNLKYRMTNCFSQSKSQQTFIQQLAYSIQKQNQNIFIIDECDQIQGLQRMIGSIRQKNPQCKIILICNNSCDIKFKGKDRISRLYFMPYTEQQLNNITKHKLAQLSKHVPPHVRTEATKKASKAGGDFRELQKYITSWCRGNHTGQQNLRDDQVNGQEAYSIINSTFADPTEQLIKLLVARNNSFQNNLLLEVIKTEEKEEEELQKKKISKKTKLNKCRCQRNTLRKLVKQMHLFLSKNQCEIFLKQWEEMGLIKLSSGICSNHKIENVIISVLVRKQVLKSAITKQFC